MTEKQFIQELIILADSREKEIYQFPNHKVEVCALSCGDYSIKGLELEFSIEVKKKDLIQSICQDRKRFTKELERSRALKYFSIKFISNSYKLTCNNSINRMISNFAGIAVGFRSYIKLNLLLLLLLLLISWCFDIWIYFVYLSSRAAFP